MLAATAVLPSINDLVDPSGEGGRVPGMAVPLASGATKEDLDRPLQRGVYAVSSPDQKTVLKLRVFSKEEARFSPESVLDSVLGANLDLDSRERIRATWTILQLTYESYDPDLYPALRFLLEVASKLATLSEGLIADPLSRIYRKASSVPSPAQPGMEFNVLDFVATEKTFEHDTWTVRTAGLVKFDQPEIQISQVPEAFVRAAESLMMSVSSGIMRGKTLSVGDKLISETGWIVAGSASELGPIAKELGIGSRMYELLPAGSKTVSESLAEWNGSHGQ